MSEYVIYCIAFVCAINIIYYGLEVRVKTRQKKYIQLFIILLFAFLVAFHPSDIRDVAQYMSAFDNCDSWIQSSGSIDIFNKTHSFEYGFLYLCSAFRKVCPDIRFMYFVIAVLNATLLPAFLHGIDENTDIGQLRCTYLTWYGILYNAISFRAGIIMTLGIGAVYFCRKNKYFCTIAFLLAGFLIQRSCIIFVVIIVLYLLGKKESSDTLNKWFARIAAIEFLLLPLNIGSRLSGTVDLLLSTVLNYLRIGSYYNSYVLDNDNTALGITKYLVCFCIVLVFWALYRTKTYMKKYQLYVLLLTLNMVVFLVGVRAASRVYDMGLMFCIPMLGNLVQGKHYDVSLDTGAAVYGRYMIFAQWFIYLALAFVGMKTCFF